MTNMDLLAFLLVGALLGAAGQGARLVVVVSLVLGAVAGVAAAVGADFFGGLLKRAP